ncbi:AAA family ATPase [Rhodoplanes sp. TEM]|uniref:AAA family ATPase n=1 Tax=Rhodoplanes tepidamans TaxID=200616 RepID=A0ABT5JL10_RHOTP|nr:MULTISPECIES: AAA family ATPase [Rhodoplanes]MDC7789620.1 AAA family ATPase [Rhodoplanes tepidamans]MDC7988063.1 AAA family ATPase [Rhodoplanes sp. TEM]MDQ0359189.1 cellulose biosynthesis protein BcsQ [Rhodoplanes tepidamans]
MKAIAVFNNKGGVGKTTLLANLASYLALKNMRRVLIVDADPQCNITQIMFTDDEVDSLYGSKDTFTIDKIIHPLSIGRGYVEEIEFRRCKEYGVDILIGDPQLSLREDLLARDWSQAVGGEARGIRTSYVFSELLTKCRHYDYVFFDVGPSLGAINRSVLLASDFFISPLSIDIFSLRAIENIRLSIEKWRKQLDTAFELLEDISVLPRGTKRRFDIKFLGYVTQQYIAKTTSGERQAVAAYERIMRRLWPTINSNFVRHLQPELGGIEYLLGTIPNLYSLIPMSQFARRPIFALRAKDGVRGAHFNKVIESEALFREIASRFEENIGLVS